jgi:hypothetical protein
MAKKKETKRYTGKLFCDAWVEIGAKCKKDKKNYAEFIKLMAKASPTDDYSTAQVERRLNTMLKALKKDGIKPPPYPKERVSQASKYFKEHYAKNKK